MDVFIPTNKSMYEAYRTIQYRSVKLIAGIKSNPSKDRILDEYAGSSFKCFTADSIKSKMDNMGINNGYLCSDCNNHQYKAFDDVP